MFSSLTRMKKSWLTWAQQTIYLNKIIYPPSPLSKDKNLLRDYSSKEENLLKSEREVRSPNVRRFQSKPKTKDSQSFSEGIGFNVRSRVEGSVWLFSSKKGLLTQRSTPSHLTMRHTSTLRVLCIPCHNNLSPRHRGSSSAAGLTDLADNTDSRSVDTDRRHTATGSSVGTPQDRRSLGIV